MRRIKVKPAHRADTGFEEEGGILFIVVYDNKEEYHKAIDQAAKESKPGDRPYVGLAGNPGFPVIGGD